MLKVKNIFAYEIIDSRGFPTIEARMTLDNGYEAITSVPSGTSIGKYEAVELRDNDRSRFDGMGVSTSVSYINELIAPKLIGVSPQKQKEIDYWLVKADGTKNKSHLGANTILAVSQLFVKAAAYELGLPVYAYVNHVYKNNFSQPITLERVPTPIFNIINGGKHANNTLEFQEFQIIPSSSFSFTKAYQIGVEFYHELKRVLIYRNANISVGEEGGFTPNLMTNADALEVLKETANRKNLKLGIDIFFGLDLAASHFYKNERYMIKDKQKPLTTQEFLDFLINLTKTYRMLIMEDPINQDDWASWSKLDEAIAQDIYLVGDDLLTTNKERLERAIKEHSCSTILIKPNQIGTIMETLEVIDIARKNNINIIVSHRSGETNDDFIADFAMGVQSDFVKFGAPSRGERVAKYNRLWQIERTLSQKK